MWGEKVSDEIASDGGEGSSRWFAAAHSTYGGWLAWERRREGSSDAHLKTLCVAGWGL